MSDKKNIIIAILIFVLFFLLFPLNLVQNISYTTNESTELTGKIKPLPQDKMPFLYKNRAGYFSSDLSKSWGMDISDGVVLLRDSYINFSREENIVIKGLDGNIKYEVDDDGYPFSIGDRLYIIGRDRKSLTEIVDGKKLWSKSFNYVITSIDGNRDCVAIGFIKGFFTILDSNGEIFFNYEPGGSRVSIIYSIAISEDNRYLSIISGLDPQRFILYELRGEEYKPLYTINLDKEVKRSLKIFMTSDNKSVFVPSANGFYIVDIESKSSTFIEDNQNLKNVKYIPELDIYMILSGAVNYNQLKLFTTDNRVLLEKSFIGESVLVNAMGRSIYIVIDNSVIKIDIEEGI